MSKYEKMTKTQLIEEVGALRLSEERFRAFTENAPDFVMQVGQDGTIEFINRTLEEFTREDVVESSVFSWIPDAYLAPYESALSHVFETGTGKVLEHQVWDAQIGTRWYSSHLGPIEKDGHVTSAMVVGRDITERKQAEEALRGSEERLETLLNATTESAFLAEVDGKLLAVNGALAESLGRNRDELVGRRIWEFLPPESADRRRSVLREIMESKEPSQGGDTNAGKSFEYSVYPILDEDGEVKQIAVFAKDVTERKQSEEMREKLQSQLAQAQKMESVGLLAGGIAHDFNNMLSVILGNADMALDLVDASEPIFDRLNEIRNAARHSADLTRQLLAFARKQTVAPKVLDLNDTTGGVLKMLRRVIGEDIDLAWMPGADLWPVRLDPAQVDQVLANLCMNARDAIFGVGKVTIQTENAVLDQDACATNPDLRVGEFVVLTVSDDGEGMEKELVDHIFEPFFSTKQVGLGTGLGLATLYGIVKQNDGLVSVQTEVGVGTTFKIYLPRHVGEVEKAAEPQADIRPRGQGDTLLLVEDEPAVLKMGKAMLEELGYTVLTAGTPGDALRQAKTQAGEIQLLITDVVMPEMNGRELADQARAFSPGLKTLFLSGYAADVITRKGVLDEAVHFLPKPFTIDELAASVKDALGSA